MEGKKGMKTDIMTDQPMRNPHPTLGYCGSRPNGTPKCPELYLPKCMCPKEIRCEIGAVPDDTRCLRSKFNPNNWPASTDEPA